MMLCSIFRSLFWVQTFATKVKYGFFHLRNSVDFQNVSDFGPFGICFFVLGMLSLLRLAFSSVFSGCQWSCSHSLGLPHRQCGGYPPHDLSADDWVCPISQTAIITFSFPWEIVQDRKHWVFDRILLTLISWISSFSLLSPVTRGHWCSISYWG